MDVELIAPVAIEQGMRLLFIKPEKLTKSTEIIEKLYNIHGEDTFLAREKEVNDTNITQNKKAEV